MDAFSKKEIMHFNQNIITLLWNAAKAKEIQKVMEISEQPKHKKFSKAQTTSIKQLEKQKTWLKKTLNHQHRYPKKGRKYLHLGTLTNIFVCNLCLTTTTTTTNPESISVYFIDSFRYQPEYPQIAQL